MNVVAIKKRRAPAPAAPNPSPVIRSKAQCAEGLTQMRQKPLRWRDITSHRGPTARGLFRDGVHLASAQRKNDCTWFWYGNGRNSSNRPTTREAAQDEAVKFIRELGL